MDELGLELDELDEQAEVDEAIASGWTLEQVQARQQQMWDTLSGCDWCCGGGDQEMAFLNRVQLALLAKS